jgi:pimeloyl-ACP methyl ester carboxylesterase
MPTLARGDATLHYSLAGEGPPILFIQGVGVIGAGWQPQVDMLRERFTCCTFDNRGIGQSTSERPPASIEQLAGDALALLDTLGWAQAHVVGHSMGGLIAEQLALAARERVLGLALLCTPASGRAGARPSARIAWIGMRSRVGTRAMRRRAFLELVLPRAMQTNAAELDAWAERLALLFGRDLADNPPIVLQQLRAMAKHDVRARLHELAGVPTLVVSAREDPIAPPQAGASTAASIPGATHVVIEDASHGVPITHAARINALVAEALAKP